MTPTQSRLTTIGPLPPVRRSEAYKATWQADVTYWKYGDALEQAFEMDDHDEAQRILRDAMEAAYELAERKGE